MTQEASDKSAATGNPLAHGVSVSVTMPGEITIRMVDASALNDYELWVFLASSALSVFSGFLVATIQAYSANDRIALPMTFMSLVLLVTIIAFGWKAISVRRKITTPGKSFNLTR